MGVYEILVYLLAYIALFAASFYVLGLIFYFKKKDIPKEAKNKTVSIIIPAYNEEKNIEKTINSILSLDYPKEKLEIIVVDDGSKDNTYAIAKKFESSKEFAVRVFTKENEGKGSALNFGIRKSKNEIVVTMDADTVVQPDALKIMIGYFYNRQIMAVTPSVGIYKPKTFWQRIQHIEYYLGIFLRKSFAVVNAMHITPGAFSAYRRKFFIKHGGFDEKNITEDLEIALRIQNHDYIIENAPNAVVYTVSPKSFRELYFQRRRWYTGMIKNFKKYKNLFGKEKGVLGLIVLPLAVISVILSISLTIFVVIRTLLKIKKELIILEAVNFKFVSLTELNFYILKSYFSTLFYELFSNNVFLISIFFIILLQFYLHFARKKAGFQKKSNLNFVLFILVYSLLFSFWWVVSFFYTLLKKDVRWGKDG